MGARELTRLFLGLEKQTLIPLFHLIALVLPAGVIAVHLCLIRFVPLDEEALKPAIASFVSFGLSSTTFG